MTALSMIVDGDIGTGLGGGDCGRVVLMQHNSLVRKYAMMLLMSVRGEELMEARKSF